MISLSTQTIPQELVKRSLIYSIVAIILGPFLSLLSLFLPLPFDVHLYILVWGFIYFLLGLVSLLLYFFNPEIAYGMWISRKKAKNFKTRYIKIGKRIQMAILLFGLVIFIAVFILIMRVLYQ